MKKNTNLKLALILTISIVIIMQIITMLVVEKLQNTSIEFIKDTINITYIENKGGAFGIGQDDTLTFILVNVIVIAIILHFMISQKDRIDKKSLTSICFILAGGISNLIDRIYRGAVIDYIDISPAMEFPVFNLADSFLCIGWIMLIVSIIRDWKESSYKAKELERDIKNGKHEIHNTKETGRN